MVHNRYNDQDLSIEETGGGVLVAASRDPSIRVPTSGVEWRIAALRPGETRTIRYRARVNRRLRHGQIVSSTAKMEGPFRPTADTVEIRIIERLPQTGIAGFTRTRNRSEYVRSPRNSIVRPATSVPANAESLPLAVAISVTLLGVSLGGLVARKITL